MRHGRTADARRASGIGLTMKDRLLVWAFRAAWRWLPRVPEQRAKFVTRLIADFVWLRNGKGVRQLQRNLARVVPGDEERIRDLTREGIRKYADYWRVLFQISGWSDELLMQRVVFHHRERIDEALATGRGVVVASTHSGNWDHCGIAVARMFNGITSVGERLRPEELFDTFVAHRAPHNIEVIPHRGGPRPPFDILKERLAAGKLVGLVSDRDLSRHGLEVGFFDAPARMAAGPAALAVATGAILVPCAMWVEGDVSHMLAHQPIDVPADDPEAIGYLTQRIADVFARDIAAHPTDWHMLQRVWVEDLDR